MSDTFIGEHIFCDDFSFDTVQGAGFLHAGYSNFDSEPFNFIEDQMDAIKL